MEILLLKNFGVALVLSFMIGLEREHKARTEKEMSFAGVRTFTLIGLLGALVYYFMDISVWIAAILSLGFVGLLTASYVMTARNPNSVGMTTEISALLVFVVGIIAAMGDYFVATVLTLAVMMILHFKVFIHRWADQINNKEIVATIEFLLIAFVVLPLLPNESFGPYGFFNPYLAWLMVVLISGLSFLSYVAMKVFGSQKGIGITGFLAGFISSTALTLSFSEQSKKNLSVVNPYVVAVLVASSAMFFRVLIEVSVISSELTQYLVWPMVVMGLTGLLMASLFWFKKEKTPKKVSESLNELKSPFSLLPALQFGLFFVAISLFANIASNLWGHNGVYATSIISGILDVNAITVSISNLFEAGDLAHSTAVQAIALAAMTNTFIKGGIFLLFAGRKAGLRVSLSMLVIIASGSILLLIWSLS